MKNKKNKITEKKTDIRLKNLKPPWKKGEKVKGAGHPKGQRNYITIYREALLKIGKAVNKTPEQIETMMEEVGIKRGLAGNFAFWKDVRDRIHGQATQKSEVITTIEIKDDEKDKLNKLFNETDERTN